MQTHRNASRTTMSRTIPAWTIAGILAAMLIATLHALVGYMLDLRTWGTIGQRTDTPNVDPLGGDWQ